MYLIVEAAFAAVARFATEHHRRVGALARGTAIALIGLIVLGCTTACPTAEPIATATLEPSAEPSGTAEPELTFALLDACIVLDQKSAETIVQTPLETGQPGNAREPSCLYAGPVSGPLAQVEIYIGDGAKKSYDIDVELNHEFVPVPGLADEAYIEDNDIFFRKGTTWVSIRLVRLNDPAANREPLIAAAKVVAARLP